MNPALLINATTRRAAAAVTAPSFTLMDSGGNASTLGFGGSQSGGTFVQTNGDTYIIFVASYRSSGTPTLAVSGNFSGLTFTQIGSQVGGGGVRAVAAFKATASSTQASQNLIFTGGGGFSPGGFIWAVVKVTFTGTLSIQTVGNSGTATSGTLTEGAGAPAGSRQLAFMTNSPSASLNDNITGAGTSLYSVQVSNASRPTNGLLVNSTAETNTFTGSWTNSIEWAGITANVAGS